MNLVIDASVVIKWFVEEDLSEKALRLFERREPFCAPDLVIPEVTNIAWKKAVRGEITNEQALRIAKAIQGDSLVIYPSILLNDRALEIALALNHPVYDCLYITCAEAVGGVLITADQKLSNITKGSDFEDLVAYVGDMQISEDGMFSFLQIPLEKVGEIIRLSKLVWATEAHLRRSLAGGKQFSLVNVKDLTPLWDSPGWVKLVSFVKALPENERIDLLALGWLGQGYSGCKWPPIQDRARSTLQNSAQNYLRYICSLTCYLEKGVGLLQRKA